LLALLSPQEGHSPNADDLSTLYWVMIALGGILLVAINLALLAIVGRFRAGRGKEPRRLKVRRPVQLGLAAALGGLATIVFVVGVIFTEDAKTVEASGPDGLQTASLITAQRSLDVPAPDDDTLAPLEINACGQQWLWRYEYPDGTYSFYELVAPVDTAVIVHLCSIDVVHRWWVPGLTGKSDAAPGESNQAWFKADEEGVYEGASYAFSGAAYAVMRTQVRVVDVPTYQSWLDQQAQGIQDAQAFVQQVNAEGG
jgi:heme/copper-type cytochrome/quinol oxidase subunit 2